MTDEQLKLCPFCNGRIVAFIENVDGRGLLHFVMCRGCGARSAKYETTDLAGEAWNQRAKS